MLVYEPEQKYLDSSIVLFMHDVHRLCNKMADNSPFPPTVQKWSQNILEYESCHLAPITLFYNRDVKPLYQGPADTCTRPIVSQSQLSITMFQSILRTTNNESNPKHLLVFLVWSMSHPLTWRRQDLWPIPLAATRGRSRNIGSTLGAVFLDSFWI